jgi:hypothetical protein
MGAFIKLSGVTFTGGNMPSVRDLAAEILALPGLVSWHSARPEYLLLDESGRVTTWYNRISGAPVFAARVGENKPLYLASDANANQGVQFVRANGEVLDYGGTYPFGAAAVASRFLIGSFVAPVVSTVEHYFNFETTTETERNTLCGTSGFVRAIVDQTQPNASTAWSPGPSLKVLGFGHDATNNLLASCIGETITEVASSVDVFSGSINLSQSNTTQAANMTVQDAFIFDEYVLEAGNDALVLINEYAAARYNASA